MTVLITSLSSQYFKAGAKAQLGTDKICQNKKAMNTTESNYFNY